MCQPNQRILCLGLPFKSVGIIHYPKFPESNQYPKSLPSVESDHNLPSHSSCSALVLFLGKNLCYQQSERQAVLPHIGWNLKSLHILWKALNPMHHGLEKRLPKEVLLWLISSDSNTAKISSKHNRQQKRTTKMLSVDLAPSRKDSYFRWNKQSDAVFHCCTIVLRILLLLYTS